MRKKHMDKNAKRLLDIIRNSGVNTDTTPGILNNTKMAPEANTNVPEGVAAGAAQRSAPTNLNTARPGAMPLAEPTLQPEAAPTGDVAMPGDPDLQTKINALRRLRGGM